MIPFLSRRSVVTPCTIEIEHSERSLHAHVALDGEPELRPGDRVRAMLAAENSPFVVPRDAAALSAALRSLANDADMAKSVGAANAAAANANFTQARMFAAFGDLLGLGLELVPAL